MPASSSDLHPELAKLPYLPYAHIGNRELEEMVVGPNKTLIIAFIYLFLFLPENSAYGLNTTLFALPYRRVMQVAFYLHDSSAPWPLWNVEIPVNALHQPD